MARHGTVVIVGGFGPAGALEHSYARAFLACGWEVHRFDMSVAVNRNCRLGRLGRTFNRFVLVEPWIRKANRELIVQCQSLAPDLVVVCGAADVRAGALGTIATSTSAKLAWIWPDTLLNLSSHLIQALPLYGLVASYSERSLSVLRSLGARSPEWIPLAGDPELHPALTLDAAERAVYGCDISFVGNYRPERAAALEQLCARWQVKIWGGHGWAEAGKRNRAVASAWQGRQASDAEFAKASVGARLCLNVIDQTNYPAANMRVFEIPTTGALELCSRCPELEGELRHGEHLFYFDQRDDLPRLVEEILRDDARCTRIAAAGHRAILDRHTYKHRVERMLELLAMEPTAYETRALP